MIKFLLKGLFRDSGRSRIPMLVVAVGVALTVFMNAYVTGVMSDTIETNARFSTGHVKVMTRAYAEEVNQSPNDLALLGVNDLIISLENKYPQLDWSPRIQFGGLLDVPDSKGETKTQGPFIGIALDLFSNNNKEITRLNLSSSLIRGNLPMKPGQILLSEEYAQKIEVNPGDYITLISSTMNGSMSMQNFSVSGTIRFGVGALDRATIIVDIQDVRKTLDMADATSEILGFFKQGYYVETQAKQISYEFNSGYANIQDEYAPLMLPLRELNNMGMYVDMSNSVSAIIMAVFIFAMALVLWNTGLLGGLRRYGEIGVRLAIGERKSHIYISMLIESLMIGIAGSFLGTLVGLFFAFLMQKYGLDLTGMMEGGSVMIPNTIRARITTSDFYIGFIPGVFSIILGTALSGIGIYKRKTAQLFKELEA